MKPVPVEVPITGTQTYWRMLDNVGGFEPGQGWAGSVGFDEVIFHEGTRSIKQDKTGTCFWRDFDNPLDLSEALNFRVMSYWDPPPGFFEGTLVLNMMDTAFQSTNHAGFRKVRAYSSRVPHTDTFLAWGQVGEFIMPDPWTIDFAEVGSIGFNVLADPGKDFDGTVRIDRFEIKYARRVGQVIEASIGEPVAGQVRR